MNEHVVGNIARVLSHVTYPGLNIELHVQRTHVAARPVTLYLQVSGTEKCPVTGEDKLWTGRKWLLSEHMTTSEIVQTALKAVLTWSEHEVREKFKYRGRAVYGPHIDVERMLDVCDRYPLDARESP